METEVVEMASPFRSSRDHLGKHGIESGSIYKSTTSHPMDCATFHGHPMGDSRVIKLRRQQVPRICAVFRVGAIPSLLFFPGHLPPTNHRLDNLQNFPKFTRTARARLEAKFGTFPPFHLLLPHPFTLSSSTRSPPPHSPRRIPETVNLSAAVSRVLPQVPPQAPPPILIKRVIPSHLPHPLSAPPPSPAKRSHHHLEPVLRKGKPYLQWHLDTETLSGSRDMAHPSSCCSLSRGSRSLRLSVSTPSLSRMPQQREHRRERKRHH